jgi:hypothetical protein
LRSCTPLTRAAGCLNLEVRLYRKPISDMAITSRNQAASVEIYASVEI